MEPPIDTTNPRSPNYERPEGGSDRVEKMANEHLDILLEDVISCRDRIKEEFGELSEDVWRKLDDLAGEIDSLRGTIR
jgi:hypothetical protein